MSGSVFHNLKNFAPVQRLPSGYVLTAVGEDMLGVAEQVEASIEGLERRILGQDHKLSGRIKVTLVDALATDILMSDLAAFATRFPDIDLEIEVSYTPANLDFREADIAFRFASHPPDHLIGRRLLTCATAPYATPAYLKTHDLQDPSSGRWIGFGGKNKFPEWVRQSSFPLIPTTGKFLSLRVQLDACKAGMGLAMLPCFLAEPEAGLRRLAPATPNPRFELWLLTHRDLRTNARIRVFSEFMAAAVKNHRAAFEGTYCRHAPETGQASTSPAFHIAP